MNETHFLEELEAAGVDISGCRDRFLGNMDLYYKFLFKFLDDTNYAHVIKSIEKDNCEDAFRYAHTLKGVAANLGLQSVNKVISAIVEDLRSSNINGAGEKTEALKIEYEKICQILISNK